MNLLTAETSMLDRVDSIISKAIESDDPHYAAQQMQILLSAQQLVGKTLAKFLFLLKYSWGKFSLSKQESFNEFIVGSLNLTDNTRNTYIHYWEHRNKLPESFRDRPIRDLIPVTNAISQGYSVEEETWDDLNNATHVSEIAKIVREDIKGKPPRKGYLQLYLHEDTGDIVAWKDGQRAAVGFLDIYSDDDNVISAIERITKRAGLIRK